MIYLLLLWPASGFAYWLYRLLTDSDHFLADYTWTDQLINLAACIVLGPVLWKLK